jgi:hypothetical protein
MGRHEETAHSSESILRDVWARTVDYTSVEEQNVTRFELHLDEMYALWHVEHVLRDVQ